MPLFSEILVVLATGVAGIGLRSFRAVPVRKIGTLCLFATTFLSGFFIGDHVLWGLAFLSLWALLPWLEILTRVRRLRLPLRHRLQHRPPPTREHFPELAEFTQQIEAEGFTYVDDTGWKWGDTDQFYRLFYDEEARTEAAICFNRHDQLAFAFVSLTSRTSDGEVLRTWNSPFPATMKLSPGVKLNTVASAPGFPALLAAHRRFLNRQGFARDGLLEQEPEGLPDRIEFGAERQIDYNLDRGLIARSDEDCFRYSWRGLVFLWGQFLKDLVRLF